MQINHLYLAQSIHQIWLVQPRLLLAGLERTTDQLGAENQYHLLSPNVEGVSASMFRIEQTDSSGDRFWEFISHMHNVCISLE